MDELREGELPRAKKWVALSGVVAGDTAICSVGRAGNDLYYRGYDVAALAEDATFEEVAYLLLYGRLPSLDAAQSVQEETQDLAWFAGDAQTDAREPARFRTSHGRPAQRLLGSRHDSSRSAGP
jgi:citrate synthase